MSWRESYGTKTLYEVNELQCRLILCFNQLLEVESPSAKKFPAFYGSPRFNIMFTRPSLVLFQSNPQYDSLLLLLTH